MREAGTVLVTLLIVTAGCNTMLPFENRPNATDTVVPTAAVSVPGVTANGVTDTDRFALAHRRSLTGQSYTLRSTLRLNRTTADPMIMRRTLRVGRNHRRFRFEQRLTGDIPFSGVNRPARNRTAWSDGERAFTATTTDGTMRFARTSPSIGWRVFHGDQAIRTFFDGRIDTAVERIEYRGWDAYRIVGNRSSDPTITDGGVRAEVIVDPFGLILTLRVRGPTYRFPWIPGEGWVTITLRYDDVGQTTVSRPGWIAAAENATRT